MAVGQKITIALLDRVANRVKTVRLKAGAKDANRRGKMSIQRRGNSFGRNGGNGSKGGRLTKSVDTGVGPAAADNLGAAAGDFSHRVLENPLNGGDTLGGLNLPPRERGAVVGHFKPNDTPRTGGKR